jgi:DNA ligase-1
MLATPYDEKKVRKWPTPIIVQPKLDGFRALWNGQDFISSTGLTITSVPHLTDALRSLSHLNLPTLDGELYIHDTSFETISSIVSRKVNKHPLCRAITYRIFDVKTSENQLARATPVLPMLPPGVKLVPTYRCQTLEQAMQYLEYFVNDGYEGIIFRHPLGYYEEKRSQHLMKIKPEQQDEYPIVGYTEEVSKQGRPKGSLGAFVCETDGEVFSVGTGPALTLRDREHLWERKSLLIGRTLVVKYKRLTSRGVPREPVALEVL